MLSREDIRDILQPTEDEYEGWPEYLIGYEGPGGTFLCWMFEGHFPHYYRAGQWYPKTKRVDELRWSEVPLDEYAQCLASLSVEVMGL